MNNKNTTIILMFITIILLVNVTNTYATNSTTEKHDMTPSTYTDTNITKNSLKQDTITQVNSYNQLKQTIDKTNNEYINQTINLEKSDYIITRPITVGNGITPLSVTINGNNNTITSADYNSFITVKRRATLILNNITIGNIQSNGGCCINNVGNTTLNNVIIKNVNSTYDETNQGGSVSSTGTLTINDCRFENISYDSSTYGRAALYSTGNLSINNTLFKDNIAQRASTLYIRNSQNTTISNCSFINNYAYEKATIIVEKAKTNISNCNFYNNTANSYSLLYTIDNSDCIIQDTNITESHSSDSIIFNYHILNITNTIISDNNANKSIILNLNKMNVANSILNNNSAEIILSNEDYSNIISNQSDIYSHMYNLSDKMEELKELTVTNTTLSENSADMIIDGLNSSIKLLSNHFIDNNIVELFNGTTDTFKIVSDNVYLGNKLKSNIASGANYTFNYDEDIIVKGNISTNKIYNTTINTGVVLAYHNNTHLAGCNVEGGMFNLIIDKLPDDENQIRLTYSDYPNYHNSTTHTLINIIPKAKYEVSISNLKNSTRYNDTIEYEITVKNIGKVNITNLNLYNILPDNLTYINSTNQNITVDAINNSLLIGKLDVNDTVSTTISLQADLKDDYVIKLNIVDDENNSCLYKEIPIHILKSLVEAKINEYDLEIVSNHTIPLIIKNIGNSSADTVKVYFIYENITQTFNIESLDVNESLNIPLNIRSDSIGLHPYKIVIIDKQLNITHVVNGSFNFIRESISNIHIRISNITTYANHSINITATVENIYSYTIADCVFKINHISIKDYPVIIDNNTLCIYDYIVPGNFSRPNYLLEVKIRLSNTNITLSNQTLLILNKAKVHSIIGIDDVYPEKYVNLTATFIDEFGNNVEKGVMIFKLNGKTISSFIRINDGFASFNYLVHTVNSKLTYNFSVAYGENSRYLGNRNSSIKSISRQDSEIDITNTTFTKNMTFTMNARIYGKTNNLPAYNGKVVFKVNGKTVSPILNVSEGYVTYTVNLDYLSSINKLSVTYSGNSLFNSAKKTIIF